MTYNYEGLEIDAGQLRWIIAQQDAKIANLVDLVRQMEWFSDRFDLDTGWNWMCSICLKPKPNHESDCRLFSMLKETP